MLKECTLQERVFKNLAQLHCSKNVYTIFAEEQKKGRRQFQKFWGRLKDDEKFSYELILKKERHPKLCALTLKSLNYAFAKAYNSETDSKELKEYTSALMGKYEYGYKSFDKIIRQKELKLIEYIINEIKVSEICDDRRTQLFMRQAMTVLVLNSEMTYDEETKTILDFLLDEFEEGRAEL